MEEKPYEERLLILYASQTGNAIDVAERLGREADRRRCPVTVLSIDDFDPVSTSLGICKCKFFRMNI